MYRDNHTLTGVSEAKELLFTFGATDFFLTPRKLVKDGDAVW